MVKTAQEIQSPTSKLTVQVPRVADQLLVIGASAGGPQAIGELLAALPVDYPTAVVVVQHIPSQFTSVLAQRLDRQLDWWVREARDGELLRVGEVLLAGGDHHLLVGQDRRVALLEGPKVSGQRPSIDIAMKSAAQCFGSRCRGVLLTGMGEDGAQGLATIRAHGGATFVQDAESCVAVSMPQGALDLGVVDEVARPDGIAARLVAIAAR